MNINKISKQKCSSFWLCEDFFISFLSPNYQKKLEIIHFKQSIPKRYWKNDKSIIKY